MKKSLAKEALILLHHNEKSRYIVPQNQIQLFMLCGMFFDLLGNDDIKFLDGYIHCNKKASKDTAHPDLFEVLNKAKKSKKLRTWFGSLNFKAAKFKKSLILELQKEGELTVEHKKFIGLFSYLKTNIKRKTEHRLLVKHFKNIVLLNQEADKNELLLLNMLISTRMITVLGENREEKKRLKKKSPDFKANNPVLKEFTKALSDMEAAMIAAITASTVITTSTHN